MSIKLTTRTEAKLVDALLADALTAPEIRAITKWDEPKMSIRNAVGAIARRHELRVTAKAAVADSGRKTFAYRFLKASARKGKAKAA